VTIAAGLLCREGVLLCTDTEVTDWESKTQESKMRYFDFPGGRVCFAYAGNTRFAFSAIEKCEKRLNRKTKQPIDPYNEIESVLDKEYRRNVLSHPSQDKDHTLHYWLLIALWLDGAGTKLYVSSLTALNEVKEFECEGSGKQLAKHILKSAFYGKMAYSEALCLAAYAISLVKDTVQYCDGIGVFRFLSHNGAIATTTSQAGLGGGVCAQVERYAMGYEFLTRRLLLHIFDPTKDEQYFEKNFTTLFTDEIDRMVSEIVLERKKAQESIAISNPSLSAVHVRYLATQLAMGITKSIY
jgi:hypothetical protein